MHLYYKEFCKLAAEAMAYPILSIAHVAVSSSGTAEPDLGIIGRDLIALNNNYGFGHRIINHGVAVIAYILAKENIRHLFRAIKRKYLTSAMICICNMMVLNPSYIKISNQNNIQAILGISAQSDKSPSIIGSGGNLAQIFPAFEIIYMIIKQDELLEPNNDGIDISGAGAGDDGSGRDENDEALAETGLGYNCFIDEFFPSMVHAAYLILLQANLAQNCGAGQNRLSPASIMITFTAIFTYRTVSCTTYLYLKKIMPYCVDGGKTLWAKLSYRGLFGYFRRS